MIKTIMAVYSKNRTEKKRAYFWTLTIGRVINGVVMVVFPMSIYILMFNKDLSEQFIKFSGTSDYATYITLGTAAFTLGNATIMNVGRAMVTELRQGTFESFLLTPASRVGYIIGCHVEQWVESLLQFIFVLITGMFFGASFANFFSIYAFVAILVMSFSFFSMGTILSPIMLYTRNTYITQNTLFAIVYLVCGIIFPIAYLPKYLQVFSRIFPMTKSIELFRNVVLKGDFLDVHLWSIIEIILISCIYLIIGIYFNHWTERKIIDRIFG